MNKYIIRGTLAAVGLFVNIMAIPYNWPDGVSISVAGVGGGVCLFELIICLICYHHALWTNQDLSEQKSPDGTK